MRKRIVWSIIGLGIVGTGITAYAVVGSEHGARTDCPGTLTCPLTGEQVCQDRCPLGAPKEERARAVPCCAGSRTPKW